MNARTRDARELGELSAATTQAESAPNRPQDPEPDEEQELDSDLRLLARINEGDRQALHALYVKYYRRLVSFVHRMTGQADAAQEVVNDVMLVVWSTGRTFQGRSSVATWIFGIAYRKARKMAEKSRRWSERTLDADFDDWSELFADPEHFAQRVELEDLLEHGLAQLTAEQRAVVELTYFFGCSYEEIAAIAAVPLNTVKTRMFYARLKLKKLLFAPAGMSHSPQK
jgi:RNA polymerase sigma factor (sigma-70 family)